MTASDVHKNQSQVVTGDYEQVFVGDLIEHPANPRVGNVDVIAESIRTNGFYGALIVQRSSNYVCAGNHRLKAAMQVGMDTVPVLWADVDDDTALRILLADNRTSDVAGYNAEGLADLLEQVQREQGALTGTGYADSDLEEMLSELGRSTTVSEHERALRDPDSVPEPEHMDEVIAEHAATGDLWTIGPHRIYCGDSTDPGSFDALMQGDKADLVFTSPPYNTDVKYTEHADNADLADYLSFITSVVEQAKRAMDKGRALCWNIPQSRDAAFWRQLTAIEDLGMRYIRTYIWHKRTPGFPQWETPEEHRIRQSYANPIYEFVSVFGTGKLEVGPVAELDELLIEDVFYAASAGHTRDLPAGDSVTGMSNNAGEKAGSVGRKRPKKAHPATFPLRMVEPFVRNYAAPGEIVVDPFLGAGTTIIAAAREMRRGYGIELSPRYVDLTLWRLQNQLGELPVRNGEAYDFNEVA